MTFRYFTFNNNARCKILALLAGHTRVLATIAALFFVSYSSAFAQCPPNLVHYFPLDETTAGAYKDNMGGPDATCTTCPAPVNSQFVGAQRFNGSNTGLKLNDITNFQWGSNASFTIEFWLQSSASSSGNQVIMGRTATDTDMVWWIGLDKEGSAVFSFFDNLRGGLSIGNGDKKINDGKWHHVVVVRDGINIMNKIYVDGYLVAGFKHEYDGTFESQSPVTIGYLEKHSGTNYNGALDELMVYNRNLTEQEVRARYNKGSGSYCGTKQFAPTITSTPITYGVTEQQYSYQLTAIGNPAPNFSLVSGPSGMTVSASGEVRWVPAATGTFSIKVKAANSAGQDEQSYTITVKSGMDEKIGMLHHWMLNEGGGTTFKDFYTPVVATASPKDRPVPISGVIAGGQRFDDKNTGLDITETRNFDWKPNQSFTIELWMRTKTVPSDNQVFIGRNAQESTHWWVGMNKNAQATFILRDIGFVGVDIGQTGAKLNNGIWHQVVAVRDGASGASRLYVDGQKIAEGNYTFKDEFASPVPVTIGYLKSGAGYHFDGDLDEVKLFGRALSDAEIKERYTDTFEAITEILKFEGNFVNNTVVLDWETINETNLVMFEIERSADGEEFTKIGEVPGSGTTAEPVAYTFTDSEPLTGRSYYRLKIIKESGATTYSNTIVIENRSISGSSFKVYPNPAAGSDVTIEVTNLVPDERVEFIMSDMSGRKTTQQTMQADEVGYLNFMVSTLGSIRPGIYNLTIVTKSKTISRKLVVVN